MEEKVKELTEDNEGLNEEMTNAEDVFNVSKASLDKEQKLENDLNDIQNLLDNVMKNKTSLRNNLQ